MANRGVGSIKFGPGVRSLETPLKSISEFDHWRHSIIFSLRDGYVWGPKTKTKPYRNLTDDTGTNGKSKEDKCESVTFSLK